MSVDDLKRSGHLDAQGAPVIDPSRDMKSIPQGAATQVWCAVSPQLEGMGGVFCADCDVAPVLPMGGRTSVDAREGHVSGVDAYAVDADDAETLWTLSETMTGVRLAT